MSRSITRPGPIELLTPSQMADADRKAIMAGILNETLMRRASVAVAKVAAEMASGGRIAILAGPGNNGGDAWGAAILLEGEGLDVNLFASSPAQLMAGDAGTMARGWKGAVQPLDDFRPDGFAVVIDGLFGAGLSRDVQGSERGAIERLNAGSAKVLAIDLPSGLSGLDGQARGVAVEADRTVTFFRRKPGHLLQPGRRLSGVLQIADIGIASSVLDEICPQTFANDPDLFVARLLAARDTHHKYDRGHVAVFSGPAFQTGAARLSAMAALRGGAGLVTVLSPPSSVLVNAAHLTAIMLRRCKDEQDLSELLKDRRLATFVLGPGFGDLDRAHAYALALLRTGRALVLDADGLTAFADEPEILFGAIEMAQQPRVVLTPHDGEFARLFPDLARERSKLDRACRAAERSGAVIVLKGSDTIIAEPDGRAAINTNAPANLATAGSGDVLSGMIAAQLANGVPAFEAACAAVWLHAQAASEFGPGLIAEDLPDLMPGALRALALATASNERRAPNLRDGLRPAETSNHTAGSPSKG